MSRSQKKKKTSRTLSSLKLSPLDSSRLRRLSTPFAFRQTAHSRGRKRQPDELGSKWTSDRPTCSHGLVLLDTPSFSFFFICHKSDGRRLGLRLISKLRIRRAAWRRRWRRLYRLPLDTSAAPPLEIDTHVHSGRETICLSYRPNQWSSQLLNRDEGRRGQTDDAQSRDTCGLSAILLRRL